MDGIGKSTLAKQLLIHVCNKFDFACFLEFEDIQTKPKWEDIEKLVARNLFRGRGKKVYTENGSPLSLLKDKRVLVVADGVESEHQILPFIPSDWCGVDSRLVITTCVKGLMSQYGFIERDVPFMSPSESKELFKGQITSSLLGVISDQEELVSEVIANCEGLPLALKLLGSHLYKKLEMLGSHPRKELVVQVWRDALLRMRMDYSLDGKGKNQVWRKLRVIFDDLDEPEKTIFLDLASFDYYGSMKEQYDLNILKTAWSTMRRDMETLTESVIRNLRDSRKILFKIVGCEKLETLPETIGQQKCLVYLEIRGCPNLKVLPDSIGQLKKLESFTIVGCEKLETLPETVVQLECLLSLEIGGSPNLKGLPDSTGQLEKLKSFTIMGCEKLETIPELLRSLELWLNVDIRDCPSLLMSLGDDDDDD
ncbi:hypothetical protein R1flu_025839 [Riccia fluitans]|uniref:NB-ARC domain-containing protein n=1 Tax=Riccia fluitans TaxID=41844 RepID=A0ABD1XYW1_9MARC